MEKRLPAILLFLVFILGPVYGDYPDIYSAWIESLDNQSEINAGTTAFPILLIPSGGRYEGMGTAFTAIASGPGLIESNPAGSASERNPIIAFSHHDWIADSSIESFFFTAPVDPLGIGVGTKIIFTPFTGYDMLGNRTGSAYFVELLGMVNISIRIISTEFFFLSAGVNMKAVFRRVPDHLAPDQSAAGFPIDIGVLAKLSFLDFSIGAVLKNFGQNAIELDSPLPTIASFGMAFSPLKVLTLSADLNLPISFEPERFPAEKFDVAAGFDLAITDFLSLHGGAKIKANNPKITIGTTLNPGKISLHLNYNVDLMGDLNPFDTFSVSTELDLSREQ
jgi:hypothetical protein